MPEAKVRAVAREAVLRVEPAILADVLPVLRDNGIDVTASLCGWSPWTSHVELLVEGPGLPEVCIAGAPIKRITPTVTVHHTPVAAATYSLDVGEPSEIPFAEAVRLFGRLAEPQRTS